LIKETYTWFVNSSIRQLNYARIYQILNDGQEPLKILRATETRWLSIEPAVKRILDQWTELKAHFEISRVDDNCYTAELLHFMYRNKKNFIYLNFLYPISNMVQKTNKNFESKVADPTKLLDIKRLYSTIANKILLPTARIDIYEQDFEKYLNPLRDLGYAFESSYTENEVIDQEKENLKSRCVSFLIALAKELKNHLPDNIKILERINAFSVNECLKENKLSITDVALYYKIDAITLALIELEWENIHHIR